ncbi:Riboflavin kinase [Wickerhamiella sorbophila]|uniref:Riboflavin kinase n=1 Tax=Wickerhamiella sorbophila TaxID=45607 RepID=A0A2T0FGE7_9ASCO|nr:Riboflavin kinase [Wickerhamiella sorbophila]PRT54068.1 Riboflavin kinase [Wickerhamiella sorbophila]
MTRPLIVGPDQVGTPFPVVVETTVEAGFGRGSAELGCPTANIPPGLLAKLDTGVYYGWAVVDQAREPATVPEWVEQAKQRERKIDVNYGSKLGPLAGTCFPMVMSIGWNPFYDNKQKSAEVHIIHQFPDSFYGAAIKIVVLGFIRNEQSYDSVDALIEDIQTDIKVALHSLDRPAYAEAQNLIS